MLRRDQRVLHTVDDESRTGDPWREVEIAEAILHHVGQKADLPMKQVLDACEGADEDDSSDVVPRRQGHRGPRSQAAAKELDTVPGPLQMVNSKLHGGRCVCHHASLIACTMANAISRILDGENVNLEEISQDRAEGVTEAKILRISMEVDEEEPRMLKRQEQARHLCTIFAWNENQFAREAVDCVRGSRRWKDHPLDEVPALASGVQDDPHPQSMYST
mmetsp:Transcript_31893/g.75905  ORF Transcript_31893/g.75905 Transcript_31893/m.75905 type:complete len:219 (+) Transcript_31893:704-1360(+)